MSNHIAFPGLGSLSFDIDPVAFSFGNLEVRWYGICICLGLILAVAYAYPRFAQFHTNDDQVLNLLLLCIPSAVLGARAYYVIYKWDYYKQHLDEILRIWDGGLAIYGGLIAIFIAGYTMCRVNKYNTWGLFDLASPCFLIGQGIGRWGNFFNAEAFGYATDLPWGMSINGAAAVHPTFLYESLWNLLGVLLLTLYLNRRKFNGEVFLLYLMWYGLGRSWIEGLRADSLYIWGTNLRASQVLAIVCLLAAGGLWAYLRISKTYKPLEPVKQAETEVKEANEESKEDTPEVE